MFNKTIQLLGLNVSLTNLPDTEAEFKTMFGEDSTPIEDQTLSIVWRQYAGWWRKVFTAKLAEVSGVVRPNRDGSDKPVTDEVYFNLVKANLTEEQIQACADAVYLDFSDWNNLPSVRSGGGGRIAAQFIGLGDKAFAKIQAGGSTVENFVAMIRKDVPTFSLADEYDAKDLAKAFKLKHDAIAARETEF
jgi:hypothetical protein